MVEAPHGIVVDAQEEPLERRCRRLFLVTVAAALLTSGFARFIGVPFTASGVIFVYAVELAAAAGWAVIGFYVVTNRSHVDRRARRFIQFTVALILGCLIVTGFRFATGHSDLKSLLVVRNIFAGSWLVAGVLVFKPVPRTWVALCAVGTVPLGLAALLLSNTQSSWAYIPWQNHSIRAMLVTASLGTVTYALVSSPLGSWQRKATWPLWSYLVFATTWVGLASGSRINALLIPLVLFVCVAVAATYTKRRALAVGGAAILVAVAFLYLFQGCGTLVQYGLERTPGVAQWLVNSEQCGGAAPEDSAAAKMDDVDVSRTESSSGRLQVWRQAGHDLRENPILGVGLRQYDAEYTLGENARTLVLTPHNFVLEYGLAYGLVGVAAFLALLLYLPARRMIRGPDRWLALAPLAAIGYLLATAFVQPTLLNCGLSLWLWVPVAVLANGLRPESRPDASPDRGASAEPPATDRAG